VKLEARQKASYCMISKMSAACNRSSRTGWWMRGCDKASGCFNLRIFAALTQPSSFHLARSTRINSVAAALLLATTPRPTSCCVQ
jgi:hypothetical protein